MSTRFARLARFLASGVVVLASGCATDSRFDVGPMPFHGAESPLPPSAAHKRLSVALPRFTTSWGADVPGQRGEPSLCPRAARAVEEVLAGVPELELDRTSFEFGAATELRGRFTGDTRGVRSMRLDLTGPAGESIASAERTWSSSAGLDAEALRSAVQELLPALKSLRWSCCAIETSHRYLVIAASSASGLTVGEMLSVRKRTPLGAAAPERGDEVARVVVDAFSQLEGDRPVTFCRLWGGSISGFDPRDLVVVELDR
jgi:hypothetical protein